METKEQPKHTPVTELKAAKCLCGAAYIMKCHMPIAEEDTDIINQFKVLKSEGHEIVYLPKGETDWHDNKDCIRELKKYKTACEQINKDNPMAVAENIHAVVTALELCRDHYRQEGLIGSADACQIILNSVYKTKLQEGKR